MYKSITTAKLDNMDLELDQYADAGPREMHRRMIDSGRDAIQAARAANGVVRTRAGWAIVGILAMMGLRYGDPVVAYYVGMVMYPGLMGAVLAAAHKKRTVKKNIREARSSISALLMSGLEKKK